MFTEKQRQIYESPVGTRHDPLAIERKLRVTSGGELNTFLDMWEGDDPIQADVAEENLVRVARTAFGFQPLVEKNGVSDADTLDTLTHFLTWLSFPVSADATSPTSQQSSDCLG